MCQFSKRAEDSVMFAVVNMRLAEEHWRSICWFQVLPAKIYLASKATDANSPDVMRPLTHRICQEQAVQPTDLASRRHVGGWRLIFNIYKMRVQQLICLYNIYLLIYIIYLYIYIVYSYLWKWHILSLAHQSMLGPFGLGVGLLELQRSILIYIYI